ncbi:AAA-domain-containing protein [Aulographum hederae CBS 113979]|uniref:Peroxisomal ATPase PEX6 n=1 Tax=Aulographum hederae CBS 113979 TaxID=1176131 RepID=A0A6G1GYQ1_9PEZI|nr:AAA-domain-containing protein [Aulographum hederae CBS 113979]
MEARRADNGHRKRRRRRRSDRPAISAHLLLDERMKDDVGILSEDLFADLFPGQPKSSADTSSPIFYVAITPWMPSSIISSHTVPWTILPVRPPPPPESTKQRPHSSLQFASTSLALQSFVSALQATSPNKLAHKRDTPIEIRILDAVPLGLETVYVKLDTEALKKLDDVQAKFGGGFGGHVTAKNLEIPRKPVMRKKSQSDLADEESAKARERGWKKAVRTALRAPKLIHAGDLLPLPLPAHPITHVPPPPAKITACEPVAQGILLPSTRIVIVHSKSAIKPTKAVQAASTHTVEGIPEEDEDTSNDTFYSAAEEKSTSQGISPPGEQDSSADTLDSEVSGTEDNLSDDSEDMISLSAPMLPPTTSGTMSAFTSATPRAFGAYTNGAATPGSIYSTFTTTTARGAGSKGKLFKAQGLLEHIPDDLLHPKPSSEDDDEARVFVDTSTLAKIGCFSGDWVKLESSEEPSSHGLGQWTLASFGHGEDEHHAEWRAAKVYGLPESMSKKTARYPLQKGMDPTLGFLGMPLPSSSQVYLSPILLANLGGPTHLRLSSLMGKTTAGIPKSSSGSRSRDSPFAPPFAKEVTLLKISTPLSTDRLLQPSLFAGLKVFFERKRRVVKSGDLVGISVDEMLGKAIFQTGEDPTNDELLSKSGSRKRKASSGVAWFKVGDVVSVRSKDEDGEDIWGGVTTVDPSNTKMVQAGSEQAKLPPTMSNSWEYYLGVKKLPVITKSASKKAGSLTELPKPYISPLRRRLRELILAATSARAIHLGLPPLAILLTSNQRQIGKATIATHACEDLGLHTFAIDSFDILTEGGAGGDVKTEGFLKARAERALGCGPEYTALLVKHVDALNADRMVTALKEVLSDSRVLIATTTEVDKVPDGIRGLFTHELEMTAPDEGEREGILRGIVEAAGIRLAPDVDLSSVAVKTAALVAGDLVDVIDRAAIAKRNRLEKLASAANKIKRTADPAIAEEGFTITLKDLELAGGPFVLSLTREDLTTAVDAARKNFADSIGAPKIPNVTWDDVGGLSHIKSAVMETIQLPLSRPELFAKGMKKRSGILFYGPPGTGKTLLAKAIATEFSLNFFSVKGPELLNMYIGESEANVRRVFQRARDARPCVVFFDELDSVAPKRGNQGDSGGVMDRIVSQLLAELDGMSNGEDGGGSGVFVIGATNRPDLLDQALLRPGRFDKMLYLGISDTHEKQLKIMEALTRKFTLAPNCSLATIANTLPMTYTGADLYALCSDAMLKAITRSTSAVDEKVALHNRNNDKHHQITIAGFFDHYAKEEDTNVEVTEEDFANAKKELVPSVSVEELGHYERVRKTFEGAGQSQGKSQTQSQGLQNGKNNNANTPGNANGKATMPSNPPPPVPTPAPTSHPHPHQQQGRGRGRSREDSERPRTGHALLSFSSAASRRDSDASGTASVESAAGRKPSAGGKLRAILKGKGKGGGSNGGRGKSSSTSRSPELERGREMGSGDVEDAGLRREGGADEHADAGTHGNGNGNGNGNGTGPGDAEEDDDDFVIRTDHLKSRSSDTTAAAAAPGKDGLRGLANAFADGIAGVNGGVGGGTGMGGFSKGKGRRASLGGGGVDGNGNGNGSGDRQDGFGEGGDGDGDLYD